MLKDANTICGEQDNVAIPLVGMDYFKQDGRKRSL
jgi:hypothetical protein